MATRKKPVVAEAVVEVPTEVAVETPVVKVMDLIDAVVAASGVKKPQAKLVVEATLAALGVLLAEGSTLNLPPLGKLSVVRRKERPNAEVLVIKLRRAAEKKAKTPLAQDGEES